jgi:hypothetical protein
MNLRSKSQTSLWYDFEISKYKFPDSFWIVGAVVAAALCSQKLRMMPQSLQGL